MHLHFASADAPGASVLAIRGTADSATVPDLEQAFDRLAAAQHPLVVLDLSELSFISSLAMGCLVTLHKTVTRRGGSLRCAALQPLVAEAFSQVRLNDLIEIHDTVESALRSARADRPD